MPSVVVKEVNLATTLHHPRGWNSEISHNRKLRSYEVESAWYNNFSMSCPNDCRVPHCYFTECDEKTITIVLEDIDIAGFNKRREKPTEDETKSCLTWLANFHGNFLGTAPVGLWDIGTYWHLDTRPDELEALTDTKLKASAQKLDNLLNASPYKTIVHGDAKVANFCFSPNNKNVAAVDFQYVGGGCGIKDVAYFLGSCLSEEECETKVPILLEYYFEALSKKVATTNPTIDTLTLTENWRCLFPVAWADFQRFLKGWSPDHWKINSYSERITREVLESAAELTS